MDTTKIPDKINNFNLYKTLASPANKILGVTDTVTLPNWELMAETINLAGMAGEFESPTVGQLQNAQITIPFANLSKQGMALLEDDSDPFLIRSAEEFIDPATTSKEYVGREITMKGMTKSSNFGEIKKSGYGNPQIVKNLTYYKDMIDGDLITEIDKFNNKLIVNGKDLTAPIADLI